MTFSASRFTGRDRQRQPLSALAITLEAAEDIATCLKTPRSPDLLVSFFRAANDCQVCKFSPEQMSRVVHAVLSPLQADLNPRAAQADAGLIKSLLTKTSPSMPIALLKSYGTGQDGNIIPLGTSRYSVATLQHFTLSLRDVFLAQIKRNGMCPDIPSPALTLPIARALKLQ